MIEPTLSHYLLVSGALFSIGLLGVIVRRNLLIIYMSLELMLNSANVALVAMSRFNGNLDGQVMVLVWSRPFGLQKIKKMHMKSQHLKDHVVMIMLLQK